MRPGHRAQREHRIRLLDDGAPQPLGAADREGQRRDATIAPLAEPFGEIAARPRLAALVERDEARACRQRGEDQLRLARRQLRRRQLALFFELDDRRRRDEPAGVERLEIAERAAPLLANGEDDDADRGDPSSAVGHPPDLRHQPGTVSAQADHDCCSAAAAAGIGAPHIFSRL
jgi:hypothetical protein